MAWTSEQVCNGLVAYTCDMICQLGVSVLWHAHVQGKGKSCGTHMWHVNWVFPSERDLKRSQLMPSKVHLGFNANKYIKRNLSKTCGSGPLHMHGRYESKLGVSGPSVWRSSFKTEKYCNWTGSRPEKTRHSACSYEFFDLSKAHSLWAQNLVTIFIDWFIMMTIGRFIKWKNMQSIEGIKQLWSCIIYPKIVKNK